MVKFIIMTRGRTGSTAINDELSKINNACVMGELFLRWNYDEPFHVYPKILPFDKWKTQFWWSKFGHILDGKYISDYFDEIENIARGDDVCCFGFKVLSHHFKQRRYLLRQIKRRGYKVIYLKRNVVRQVLSGMIANERGIFNSRVDVEDTQSFSIDLNEFKKLVESESFCVKQDIQLLNRKGLDYCVVTYEEFCDDRLGFYEKIFNYLDIKEKFPENADYKIMIKDLRQTLSNYEEVKEFSMKMGYEL